LIGNVAHRNRPGGGSSAWRRSPVTSRPTRPPSESATRGLTADVWYRTEHMTYPYSVQIGVVRVVCLASDAAPRDASAPQGAINTGGGAAWLPRCRRGIDEGAHDE
jgi:hypothetical protein